MGGSSAQDDPRIGSCELEAMNRAVLGPITIIKISPFSGNILHGLTHWALDLCKRMIGQRGIDINIRTPNRRVHLPMGRRKGLGLQDAPEVLIDGSHHLYWHA